MVIYKASNSSTEQVQWIGSADSSIRPPNQPQIANRDVVFYKKCVYGPMVLKIGDYVLISNADSPEPDTVAGCDVAKILYLYELVEFQSKKDPFRAIVQWYSRPESVPHKHFDDDNICIDFGSEVVEDFRPYDPDVSIETIFCKCTVVTGDPIDSASALLSHKVKGPMFACRYKFIKVKNTYKLLPLGWAGSEENDTKKTPKKTPKSAGKKAKSATKATPLRELKSNYSTAVEFVECGNANTGMLSEEACTVSPIKILNKQAVVRLERVAMKSATKNAEINANYLTKTPSKTTGNTPTSKVIAARRNLNISLGDEAANSTMDSDIQNYSIVMADDNSPPNSMKLKLRKSERSASRRASRLLSTGSDLSDDFPASRRNSEKKRSSETESNPIQITPSKKRRADLLMDILTPSTRSVLDTPRRRSILKTPGSKSAVGTPKRNIQLSNIVEERVFEENAIISTPKRGKSRTDAPKSARKTKISRMDQEDEDYEPAIEVKSSAKKTKVSRMDQEEPADVPTTPRRRKSQVESAPLTPSQKLKLIRSGEIAPTIDSRQKSSKNQQKSDLQLTRERLHVSAIPQSLPCRETEFNNIYTFLEGKIQDQCGGCMYVSGVPGTGKTATVTGVIRSLQRQAQDDELPAFEYIEINGMRLTEPRQAYVEIYKKLTGKTVSWEHAHSLLEKRFTTTAPHRRTTVLLVDELDILCNRRQDVVYNLLDWPTKSAARLVVITIANTMDLPERLLMGKVTSRLGLTRLTFQPYTHKQLQEIVTTRLSGSESFKSDAVQLVARKVAAVSGDARRALDICRRATEIAEAGSTAKDQAVSMTHVQQALGEMIASAKVQAIKNCSKLEQVFLQAVIAEVSRTGVEETNFLNVYSQIETIAAFLGLPTPTPGRALKMCSKLGSERLIISEHCRTDVFQKIILNVSMDDVHYALQVKAN